MSRNSDRVGAQPNTDASAPQQLTQNLENNDFSFIVPTEFVDLPSGGSYYHASHPLHQKDVIEIKQMTAKEEDMLTSRTLLKKGVAIDRVLSSLIQDKTINPDSILVGDRNAIIIAARISAYGNDYNTKVTCPSCGTAQEYGFDLNKANVYNGGVSRDSDVQNNDDGTFSTTLPRTGLSITFKLLNGADEKRLLDGIEQDRKNKNAPERNVTRQLVNMIVGVNGNSTAQAVNYVVENIPSVDARHLRNAYKTANPNVTLDQHFECSECEYESELEVPLTTDFFWPNT